MKRITDFERASIELIWQEIDEANENIEHYERIGEFGLASMWIEFADTLYSYIRDRK
jgi:hypothetical protein